MWLGLCHTRYVNIIRDTEFVYLAHSVLCMCNSQQMRRKQEHSLFSGCLWQHDHIDSDCVIISLSEEETVHLWRFKDLLDSKVVSFVFKCPKMDFTNLYRSKLSHLHIKFKCAPSVLDSVHPKYKSQWASSQANFFSYPDANIIVDIIVCFTNTNVSHCLLKS